MKAIQHSVVAMTFCLLVSPLMVMAQSDSDWPLWGGTPERNMVSPETGLTFDFDLEKDKNVKWTAELGSQTYGNPIVADGRVYVGTNNGAGYRDNHPKDDDKGVLLCFDQKKPESSSGSTPARSCRLGESMTGRCRVSAAHRSLMASGCGLSPVAAKSVAAIPRDSGMEKTTVLTPPNPMRVRTKPTSCGSLI